MSKVASRVENVDLASSDKHRKHRSFYADAVVRFRKNRMATAGAVVVLLLIVIAIIAPFLTLHDPTKMYYDFALEPPSSYFPLGTDSLGRDIYSRIVVGSRISVTIGLIAVLIAAVIGVPMGVVAGYFGKQVDSVLMRLADVMLAFPGIIFAIWLISILGPSIRSVMIAIGIFSVPSFARVTRSSTLAVKQMEFITAERAIGAGSIRILIRYILPNVVQPVIILASLRVASAIIAAASLSFLGFGAQPPTPAWGAMLSDGRRYLQSAWWIAVFPGLAIMILVLATNMVGDGLRDALDPRSEGR